MIKTHKVIAIPPGRTIEEYIIYTNMSKKEFAEKMNLSETDTDKLISGEKQLTPDIAQKLETVLGAPAKFWDNLETIYRNKLRGENYVT